MTLSLFRLREGAGMKAGTNAPFHPERIPPSPNPLPQAGGG